LIAAIRSLFLRAHPPTTDINPSAQLLVMPLRNPFTRRAGANADENLHPEHRDTPGFERVDTIGSKTSSALSIRSGRDTGEYKMSGA
jgi:hypothetical protein